MLSKVRETFEVLSCLHSCLAFILSPSISTVFSLISLFLQCFSALCQSCMPITTKPTCAKKKEYSFLRGVVEREERQERESVWTGAHRGMFWGRAKCTEFATGDLLSDSAWRER